MPYFNSIKVRLEHPTALPLYLRKLFQFHKGTIRTCEEPNSRCRATTFQFHKGTIRTYRCTPVLDFAHIFQFHKGTIRTR